MKCSLCQIARIPWLSRLGVCPKCSACGARYRPARVGFIAYWGVTFIVSGLGSLGLFGAIYFWSFWPFVGVFLAVIIAHALVPLALDTEDPVNTTIETRLMCESKIKDSRVH